MSDLAVPTPTHVGTWGPRAAVGTLRVVAGGAPASVTWVANLAIYVPIWLPYPYLVRRLWWMNGSAASNADMGVYTKGGVKLASAGSVAQTPASLIQYATLGTPLLLQPGAYYFAWGSTGTTNRGFGLTSATVPALRSGGVLQQATAVALPATATFAVVSDALYPWCGVTRTA